MPRCRRSPDSAFLMTPDQYLAHREAMLKAGNLYLAKQFENLWQMRMVRLMKEAPESVPECPSPSIVPLA